MTGRPPYTRRRAVGMDGQTAMLLRARPGSRNEWGEWVMARRSEESFDLEHWPRARRRGLRDGDGARLSDQRHLLTFSEVFAVADGADGDMLLLDGEYWRVVEVRRHAAQTNERADRYGDVMREAIIERLDDQSAPASARPVGSSAIERTVRRYVAIGSDLLVRDAEGVITGQHVIPANGPGPRPESEIHATVLLRDEGQKGHASDVVLPDGQALGKSITLQRSAGISLQFFGAGAHDTARSFLSWVETDEAREEEVCRQFAVRHPLKFRRADQISHAEWETRAAIDIDIDYLHTTDSEIPPLGAAAIELGTSEGLSGRIDLEA